MSHPTHYAKTDVLLAQLGKNCFELLRLRLFGKGETLRADKVFYLIPMKFTKISLLVWFGFFVTRFLGAGVGWAWFAWSRS